MAFIPQQAISRPSALIPLMVGLTPFYLYFLLEALFPYFHSPSARVGSMLDSVGAITALLLAVHLYTARAAQANPSYLHWAIYSCLNIVVLKLFSSFSESGTVGWADPLMAPIGAAPFLFGLVSEEKREAFHLDLWAWIVFAASIVFSIVVLASPARFPPAIVSNQSVPLANGIRMLGVAIYFVVGIYYLRLYQRARRLEDGVFAHFCVVLFSAHLLTCFAVVGSAGWWMLEAMRPLPYFFAMLAFFPGYRNAARDLSEREAQFRLVFERAPMGIGVFDRHYRYIRVNRALCEMLGYTEKELLQKTVLAVTYPEDLGESIRQKEELFRGIRSQVNLDKRYIKKSGELIWVNTATSILPQSETNELCAIGLVEDISERLRANHLEKEKAVFEAANQAKSDFIATLSHEIRTPLTSITGFSQILAQSENLSDVQAQALHRVLSNAKLLSDLVEGILDYSRIEAGKVVVEKEFFALETVLEEVLGAVELQSSSKGNSITMTHVNHIGVIYSDPKRLRQILINLLANAVKFTEKGTINLRVEPHPNGNIEFLVSDTGCGIAPSDQEHLFSAYARADRSVAKHIPGSGLGLFISRRLANALGGDLRLVRSEVGKGSVFSLVIRAQDARNTRQAIV